MNEFNLNFYKGKKVLVTGHTGFKGTWLCRILQELGAEVTGYSQKPPTDPSIFTLTDLESQIHSVIGDIRDLEHMIQVFKRNTAGDRLSSGGTADRKGILQKSGKYL